MACIPPASIVYLPLLLALGGSVGGCLSLNRGGGAIDEGPDAPAYAADWLGPDAVREAAHPARVGGNGADPADAVAALDAASKRQFAEPLPDPNPDRSGDALDSTARFTVAVDGIPIREVLFALAEEAAIDIDLAADLEGVVTLRATGQTLEQILNRLASQVPLRWRIRDDALLVQADAPFYHTYEVGYVNLARDVASDVSVSTRVATTGQTGVADATAGPARGDNESRTELTTRSFNRFWETLHANILALLGVPAAGHSVDPRVLVNAEAGLLTVLATARQHAEVAAYIEQVLRHARRQVLIEATIVEVTLNRQYQAGIDWGLVNGEGAGLSVRQEQLGAVTDGFINNSLSRFVMGYADPGWGNAAVNLTLRLLEEFGDTRVLSSPRLMALNNQTAVLKVVEELVYFNIDVTNVNPTNTNAGQTFVASQVRSVPVGVVMAVTPQVSADLTVTLTVRPTISQQIGTVVDPTPQLINDIYGGIGGTQITNNIPVIRVREMESVLRIKDGQVVVLGGLMQDELSSGERAVPGLSAIPLLGDLLFTTHEEVARKTELVVLLRPRVVEPGLTRAPGESETFAPASLGPLSGAIISSPHFSPSDASPAETYRAGSFRAELSPEPMPAPPVPGQRG